MMVTQNTLGTCEGCFSIFFCFSVSLFLCFSVSLLLCFSLFATLFLCYSVTLFLCYSVSLFLCFFLLSNMFLQTSFLCPLRLNYFPLEAINLFLPGAYSGRGGGGGDQGLPPPTKLSLIFTVFITRLSGALFRGIVYCLSRKS